MVKKKREFIITVEYGTKSPDEWLAKRLKEFAKDKYGLDLKVEINPEYLNQKKKKAEIGRKIEVSETV